MINDRPSVVRCVTWNFNLNLKIIISCVKPYGLEVKLTLELSPFCQNPQHPGQDDKKENTFVMIMTHLDDNDQCRAEECWIGIRVKDS